MFKLLPKIQVLLLLLFCLPVFNFAQQEKSITSSVYSHSIHPVPGGIIVSPGIISVNHQKYFSPTIGFSVNDRSNRSFSRISFNRTRVGKVLLSTPSAKLGFDLNRDVCAFFNGSITFISEDSIVDQINSAGIGLLASIDLTEDILFTGMFGFSFSQYNEDSSGSFTFGSGLTIPLPDGGFFQSAFESAFDPSSDTKSWGISLSLIFSGLN